MHPAEPGDTYLHDGISYRLTVEHEVIVTEPMESDAGRGGHGQHGEWWWRNAVPDDVVIEQWPGQDAQAIERAARVLWRNDLQEYELEWEVNADSYRLLARAVAAALRNEREDDDGS
jgi:hypothetical protein